MKKDLEIRKVLIVDDEPDLRDVLSRMMKGLNIESQQAENGRVALDLLKHNVFHAVLCDIMMPEMTGIECLAAAQIEGITTPFIFITGYSDKSRMLQAVRLGALDFIAKPFDNAEVADVIFRVLEIGTRRAQMFKDLESANPSLYLDMKKNERMISMMKARNNQKRTG